MSATSSPRTPEQLLQEAGVPVVDLTGLQRRLRGRAEELRLAVAQHRAVHATSDGSGIRLRAEAVRAAELLDDTARMIEGPL